MGFITRIILIAIIIVLLLAFIPKHNGTVICFGCEDRECKCLGYDKPVAEGSTCVGIPYACEKLSEENAFIEETLTS